MPIEYLEDWDTCMCDDCIEFGWHGSYHAIQARKYETILEKELIKLTP